LASRTRKRADEIKRDGYRLRRREGDVVRRFTRRGYHWSGRHPSIAVTATLLRGRSFTLDGEAVVCGPDGVAIFDALHRRGTVTEAMLYAFDLLEIDGKNLRPLPLFDRKWRLAKLIGSVASGSGPSSPPTGRWRGRYSGCSSRCNAVKLWLPALFYQRRRRRSRSTANERCDKAGGREFACRKYRHEIGDTPQTKGGHHARAFVGLHFRNCRLRRHRRRFVARD
jgi:hypothetical protein